MLFKSLDFKKRVRAERVKVFSHMKDEKDITKWRELKERYDTYDRMENPRGRVTSSDFVGIAGTLLSILLVLHYEKLDNITSKAWNWIKPKKL